MRVPVALFLLAATMISGASVAADPSGQAKHSASPKKEKTNFFTADNGLGAAALGEIGLTIGAMALSGPQAWYGYPREEGIPFANDAGTGAGMDDCAASDGGNVAKALMAQNDGEQKPPPPGGVLRMTDAERQAAAGAYDSKAIYEGSSCRPHGE